MNENRVKVAITGVDEFSATFGKFEHSLGSAKQNLMHFAEAAGLAYAGDFIAKTVESIDHMGKLAQKTGLGTAAMSQFAYAAKLSDVPIDVFAKSVEKLSKSMLSMEDSAGVKGAGAALLSIGVSVRTATGELRSSEDVIMDVADRFAHMKDGAEKTGLAMQIFGKAGAEMIPLLNEGRDGLEEMRKEADDLGLTITDKTAAAAQKFDDDLKRMQAQAEGLSLHFVEGLLPAITGVTTALSKNSGQMNTAEEAGRGLGDIVTFVAKGFFAAAYALDYYILKLEKHQQVILALMQGNFAGLGSAFAVDSLAAKELDAQLGELVVGFNKMFAALDEGGGKAHKTLGGDAGGVGKDVDELSKAAQKAQEQFAALAADMAKQGDTTLAVLEKVRAHKGDIATIDKDIADLTKRLEELQADLAKHPGEFLPSTVKQVQDTKAELEDLKKVRDKLDQPPNVGVLPGGPINGPQDIPINVPNGPLEQQAERMKKIHDLWQQLGSDIGDQVKQAALYGRSWGDVFKALIVDIGMAIIKFEILKHVQVTASSPSSGGGVGGGILGAIFGGLFGHKAAGGPVSGSTPYLVGEVGPELFIPSSSGSIVPNYMLGGGAGAAGIGKLDVVLHVTSDVDLKIQKAMVRAANAGAMQAVNVIQERKLRTT